VACELNDGGTESLAAVQDDKSTINGKINLFDMANKYIGKKMILD
jgi:hypothetical protein